MCLLNVASILENRLTARIIARFPLPYYNAANKKGEHRPSLLKQLYTAAPGWERKTPVNYEGFLQDRFLLLSVDGRNDSGRKPDRAIV